MTDFERLNAISRAKQDLRDAKNDIKALMELPEKSVISKDVLARLSRTFGNLTLVENHLNRLGEYEK